MKEDIEFQIFGKEIPYKIPPCFFDTISERTLQEAKLRGYKQRKTRRLWLTVSVAASLTAILFLGFYNLIPGIKPMPNLFVQELLPHGKHIIHQKWKNAKESTAARTENASLEKAIVKTTETEAINDVLADLTDDELSQMAARFQSDPFIIESVQ